MLNSFVTSVNGVLWSYVLIILLLGLGVYFTIRTGFVQVRHLKEMFYVLKDRPKGGSDKDITSLQAFFIGAATRIGTGNVVGVATAIALGGPGAVFWMWMVAIVGSASAFVESTLAQIYKERDEVGFRGGPGYYIKKQLGSKLMSGIYAITILLSFGLVFIAVQSNTIASSFNRSFDLSTTMVGIVLAVLTALVIFGGVKRIARVSEIIVPVMAIFYVAMALYVFFAHITEIPMVLVTIFKGAFGLDQVVGGGFGAALSWGVKRGLFSNEAGMGSAPNAAATAVVSHPVKQGLIQALGVFFDTLIVCSATAFMILTAGVKPSEKLQDIQLTQAAMGDHFGSWAGAFLAIAIFTFAFSSIIGNSYYGESNLRFLNNHRVTTVIYRILAIGMVIFGAKAKFDLVWNLADMTMALMALTNLIAIMLLGKYAFAALKDYLAQREAGKDPVFYADSIEGLKGVESWEPSPQKDKTKQG
ncbi:alanine/glycine:cation symporter family protein [Marininema halotolerans]|uniref:Alanine or glycine:cation symporter, AGCS family n=1 Tax=Marininema halotolerans TaxID=1155944 RepID=A0A1I6R8T7_9BACL|nr:alanine/glycine:cation symporter family protein [Marininema halotolerans]SFS61066.1 alanine or glycine:cation symporter, AGCS family [Marininema halotolerans]